MVIRKQFALALHENVCLRTTRDERSERTKVAGNYVIHKLGTTAWHELKIPLAINISSVLQTLTEKWHG